jgi:hypothetical protein
MQVVATLCAARDVGSDPSDLKKVVYSGVQPVAKATQGCATFFANAVDDSEATMQAYGLSRIQHAQRQQGFMPNFPSFFTNTLVHATKTGYDGTMQYTHVAISLLTNIQTRPGCRFATDSSRLIAAVHAAERLGHAHISFCTLKKLSPPAIGVNISTIPYPDRTRPRHTGVLLIESAAREGEPDTAQGATLCFEEELEFTFPIEAQSKTLQSMPTDSLRVEQGDNVMCIRGIYTCTPRSRTFVTLDTALKDVFDRIWLILRHGRRLDVIPSIDQIYARIFGFIAAAHSAKQVREQALVGL